MGDLSKHFSRAEFSCRCGCGFDTVDAELITLLETIREKFGQPVLITSGCRCPSHNANVGGAPNSEHTKGRAADFVVKSVDPSIVADCAETECSPGVGRYNGWTHIDTRSGVPARWNQC